MEGGGKLFPFLPQKVMEAGKTLHEDGASYLYQTTGFSMFEFSLPSCLSPVSLESFNSNRSLYCHELRFIANQVENLNNKVKKYV